MSNEFEDEACDFIGPEECEERLDDRGVDMGEASRRRFKESDEGR